MKKGLLFIVLLFASSIYAVDYRIVTNDHRVYNGDFVNKTDSTITIYNRYTLKKMTFSFDEVSEYMPESEFNLMIRNSKKKEENKRMADPNYTIGRAFKSSGSVAIGVGVPFFVLGTILYASGVTYKPQIKNDMSYEEIFKETKKASDISTSGVIFMSIGGSLTIIGIPLYVHGKRIMDISLQTGCNGAGLAFNF